MLAVVEMGTRDDEYDYLFKGKSFSSSLPHPSPPTLSFSFSRMCDCYLFFFTYSGDVPRATLGSRAPFPPRRQRQSRRVRHAERHLVNDNRPRRPPVRGETRDDIRNDDPSSRAERWLRFSAGRRSVLPRFLRATSWSTVRRSRFSSRRCPPRRCSLPSDSALLSLRREKTPAICTLRM